MNRSLRLLLVSLGYLGIAAAETSVAIAYQNFGTWWHWLLHQFIGWGIGLTTAAVIGTLTRFRIPALVALLGGQLLSITPDLMFRFLREPHVASMDVYLGHISIHTGPSPTLVALATLLLGGWSYLAVTYGRRRTGAVLATLAIAAVTVACLLARPVPTQLSDFPLDTPPLPGAGAR